MARTIPGAEPLAAVGLPRHRAVVALDIERSTSRADSVKAELRSTLYEVFGAALLEAGIRRQYRDRFVDRGDGILALIHPVDQAPTAALLKTAVPALSRLLSDYNASLPRASRAQRQLRIRAVVHAGEVNYDANGCFGEALDIAFRLLDSAHVEKALQAAADPLILVSRATSTGPSCATDMTASTSAPSTRSSACASAGTGTPAGSTSPAKPPATR